MAFNNRTPSPLDPAVDPLLPQADSSQPHDIPTGVSPTTAKLHDWIAWISENGVFYFAPGVIANDVTISGNLTVTGTSDLAGQVSVGADVDIGGDLTIGSQPTPTTNPGANTLHATNIPKAWAYVETDGAGNTTVNDAFNLTSATITGLSIRFTFARAFATANYAVSAVSGNSASFAVVTSLAATYVDIGVYNVPTAALRDPATFSLRVHVSIMGRH